MILILFHIYEILVFFIFFFLAISLCKFFLKKITTLIQFLILYVFYLFLFNWTL